MCMTQSRMCAYKYRVLLSQLLRQSVTSQITLQATLAGYHSDMIRCLSLAPLGEGLVVVEGLLFIDVYNICTLYCNIQDISWIGTDPGMVVVSLGFDVATQTKIAAECCFVPPVGLLFTILFNRLYRYDIYFIISVTGGKSQLCCYRLTTCAFVVGLPTSATFVCGTNTVIDATRFVVKFNILSILSITSFHKSLFSQKSIVRVIRRSFFINGYISYSFGITRITGE